MEAIGRWIAYINRARQYIGIINSSVLLIILLNSFDVTLKWYWYIAIIPSTMFLFVLAGYVETKLGLRSMEIMNIEENSPLHMESFQLIKDIKNKFDENNDPVKN